MESNFHLFHIQNWLKCEKYVLIHLIHESTDIYVTLLIEIPCCI